jgi:hypothetical protein
METKRAGLTAVHVYIICFKAEVLSQMMAKWWWRLCGHGHLVEMSYFIVLLGNSTAVTEEWAINEIEIR